MKNNKGFTLIELLVVIAIIGLLSTLAVVALNSARQKSRDSKRVADMKQVQTALELYFADENGYPDDSGTLGAGDFQKLCDDAADGWVSSATACTTTYMGLVPSAPTPADGTCDATNNPYIYTAGAGTPPASYGMTFCLGGTVGDLSAGVRSANPNGIQ